MCRIILLFSILIITITGCNGTNDSANDAVYSNEFLGIKLPLPNHWRIVDNKYTSTAASESLRALHLSYSTDKTTASQVRDKILLLAVNSPTNDNIGNATRSIVLLATNTRGQEAIDTTGMFDTLIAAESIRKIMPSVSKPETKMFRIGDKVFFGTVTSLPRNNKVDHICLLFLYNNDYRIAISMSADSVSGLTELQHFIENKVQLSGVSKSVDDSSTGSSFRSELTIGPKTGWNFLMIIGAISIVLGLLQVDNRLALVATFVFIFYYLNS